MIVLMYHEVASMTMLVAPIEVLESVDAGTRWPR